MSMPEFPSSPLATPPAAPSETAAHFSAWLRGDDLPVPPPAPVALAELAERMENRPARRTSMRSWGSRTGLRTGFWAAGAALGVAITVLGYEAYVRPQTPVTGEVREYATAAGQRANITLADGTKVHLNVASRLTVHDGYGQGQRTLTLDGEAQFTVAHDAEMPFTVLANGTTVRDLATVFNIRAYVTSTETRVAVREGSVSVQSSPMSPRSAITLSAQQLAVVAQDGIPKVRPLLARDADFQWTQGTLVLRQRPLGEALSEFSRWYGLEFHAGDPALLTYSVSAKLPAAFNMQDMHDIAEVIGARAVRHGNVITLYPAAPRQIR